MSSASLDSIVALIGAAAQDKTDGWFNSEVVVALLGLIGVIVGAWLTYKGTKVARGGREANASTEGRVSPPDLASLANARVHALKTHGPAQNERIEKSRQELEKAAAALDEKEEADTRKLLLELASCTDARKAHDLRERLIERTHPATG